VAALIAAQRETHRIPHAVACRALGVSQSWFYKWKGRAPGPRAQRRDRLKAEVGRLFGVHEGKYGSPRVTADLRDAGWRVSENTVAALMREQHLAARRKKRRRGTTRPGKGRWRAPDLVKRDFPASQINRKWFGDGTEIPTDGGKLHLVSVLDVASRRVLGFTLGERHDAQLAYGALAMALAIRGGQAPGVIFHTDQGSEGGFNWSSQHLDLEVWRYGCRETSAGDSCDARPDVVARPAVDCEARGSRAVLGGDRSRRVERGRGGWGWRVAGRRLEMVPAGWRDAADHAGPAVGAVPVVR
jgi:HTH-like domain/Integrase core domain